MSDGHLLNTIFKKSLSKGYVTWIFTVTNLKTSKHYQFFKNVSLTQACLIHRSDKVVTDYLVCMDH